jgi:hypothetical protein
MEVFTLLRIRFILLGRQLKGSGAGLLVVTAVGVGLIWWTYRIYQTEYAWHLLAGILVMTYLSHINRRDKSFILHSMYKPRLQIYFQYVVYTFPITMPALFVGRFEIFLSSLVLLIPLPFIDFITKQKARLIWLSRILDPLDIEWIAGLRSKGVMILLFLIAAYIFSSYPIVSLVFLWVIGLILVQFYDHCESLDILRSGCISARRFLFLKFNRHVIYILILYIPVCLLNSLFHPEHVLLNVFFILMQCAMLAYAIFSKYSGYVPNSRAIEHNMTLSLVSVAGVLPYLFPLPFFAALETYGRAKRNLEYYFND